MRRLIITENMTVDGVIDMSAGWFDPSPSSDPGALEDQLEIEREDRESADAVLLGRQTFEDFRSYWPHVEDDVTGVSDYLNSTTKYVISSTLQDPEWENTKILRGPVLDEISTLKASPGKDIVCTGSLTLARMLATTDLVDEFRFFVHPTAVGSGVRLFDGRADLELVEARSFRTGVARLVYRPRH
jgi:dihydrofolate reductase